MLKPGARETKKEIQAPLSISLKGHLCLCCNACKSACREFHKQGDLFWVWKHPSLGSQPCKVWESGLGKVWILVKLQAGALCLDAVLEIRLGFAKHHQFASWNCLALHNLDSKWWLMGLFLHWEGKKMLIVNALRKSLNSSWASLRKWWQN